MSLFSTTLAVMRQYLSTAVNDLIEGTFDSGTTNTGIHTMLLKGDDYYNEHGYRCYIYEGAGIGDEREVDDWALSSNTLTFKPVFGTAIDNTSKYELHYIFTADEYLKAINLAIESIADEYYLDAVDVTTVLGTDTYEYAMPTSPEFHFVNRITRETAAAGGIFEDVNIIDEDFYKFTLVGSASYIKFDEAKFKIPVNDNLKDLRIEGQKRQAIVSGDTDIIYLPPTWLVNKAIIYLPLSKVESNKLERVVERAATLSAQTPQRGFYPKSKRVIN